ncbi:MAG: hypothetical protein H7226_08270 [Salinibacterium sp.]|nr:hypothetical protein [Salinibacterium sp.]
MTSFDVKRKRPWWFSWIPASVLVAIVAGVGITAGILVNSGLGGPAPQPTVGEVTDLNWSSFTVDGLAYIERSRDVRVDLSRLPADAAALGLAADGTTSIGPSENFDTDNDYYLIVNGGGEGYGGKRFTVSQLDITTVGGEIQTISAQSSAILPFRITLSSLSAQVDEFGWDPLDENAIFSDVNVAITAGVPYEFATSTGDRLGMAVSATARCQPEGSCVTEYDVTPAVG